MGLSCNSENLVSQLANHGIKIDTEKLLKETPEPQEPEQEQPEQPEPEREKLKP